MATDSLRVVRSGIAEQVIAQLSRQIEGGQLSVGARLPTQRELAAQFGVGQSSVREALQALQSMGYVDVRHGSGAYVIADADTLMTRPLRALIQLHNVSALEVLDVRRVLGMRSAPLAAKNATPDTLRGIGGALDRLAAGGDAETLTASVADFQLRIASAAGQPFLFALEAFTIRLLLHFQKIAYSDRDPAFWRDWTATPSGLRRRLFNTLKSRDSGQVSKAMEAYLKVQEKQIAGDPALSSVRMSDGAWNQAIESLATTADLVI